MRMGSEDTVTGPYIHDPPKNMNRTRNGIFVTWPPCPVWSLCGIVCFLLSRTAVRHSEATTKPRASCRQVISNSGLGHWSTRLASHFVGLGIK